MTSKEIITYIYKKRTSVENTTDTSRMINFMEKLGNPQEKLKFIHIAGTNGKGSTTTMLTNVLKSSGYKVGKYISPYIISFNERIQINNNFISNEDLEKYIKKIKPVIDEMEAQGDAPIGFEIITAIAFLYYADENCDIVCLEVGMGGRLDPTNVINNTIISIITLIDYDHCQFLGNTLKEIASEKCGIIKKNRITITYPKQNSEALETIREYCKINNNKLYIPSLKLLDIIKCNHNINYFSYKGTYYKLNLIGEHQIYNALVVILAANVLINLGYKIPFSAITTGIFETNFPARLEKISDSPTVFLDGSHNLAGAQSLKNFLYEYKGKRNYAIMSFTKGKNCKDFIKEISPFFQEIVFVKYNNEYKDSMNTENLLEISNDLSINAKTFDSLKDAYNYLVEKENTDLILITGSLYLASEYRNMLTEE